MHSLGSMFHVLISSLYQIKKFLRLLTVTLNQELGKGLTSPAAYSGNQITSGEDRCGASVPPSPSLPKTENYIPRVPVSLTGVDWWWCSCSYEIWQVRFSNSGLEVNLIIH